MTATLHRWGSLRVRDRFIASGIGIAAFTVTLVVIALQSQHPADRQHGIVPVTALTQPPVFTATPVARQTLPPIAAPAAEIPAQGLPAQADEADTTAPQPTLPDPAALPSYEQDQAAHSAEALRSARAR
jgi:hypothetical protein